MHDFASQQHTFFCSSYLARLNVGGIAGASRAWVFPILREDVWSDTENYRGAGNPIQLCGELIRTLVPLVGQGLDLGALRQLPQGGGGFVGIFPS